MSKLLTLALALLGACTMATDFETPEEAEDVGGITQAAWEACVPTLYIPTRVDGHNRWSGSQAYSVGDNVAEWKSGNAQWSLSTQQNDGECRYSTAGHISVYQDVPAAKSCHFTVYYGTHAAFCTDGTSYACPVTGLARPSFKAGPGFHTGFDNTGSYYLYRTNEAAPGLDSIAAYGMGFQPYVNRTDIKKLACYYPLAGKTYLYDRW